jgi:MGT family glycosyltransferase
MKAVFLNVSAPGHVIPTLGLVGELVRRGESVVYFEVPPFQAKIEARGAVFHAYPPIAPYPGPGGANQYYLGPVLTWCAREWVPALLERVRAERPDYIVHDSLCLWGRILAHALGVPAVASVATAGFTPRTFHACLRLRRQRRAWIAEARDGLRLFRAWRRDLATRYGLSRPINFVDTFTNAQPLNLVHLPRALQPYADAFGREYAFVGLCTATSERATDFSFERLDGRPLVYVSFGTLHNPGLAFFRSVLEAVAEREWQTVLVLSPGTELGQLGDIPANVIVCEPGKAPQLQLLERAAAFVTHGAGGGLREGAWYGVPMVAVPQTYEQEILSAQLEAQGAGVMLEPARVTAQTLGAALERTIGDPAMRERAGTLREASRTAGGAATAVDAIFAHIARIRGLRVGASVAAT